ncbi:MAG: hypothetical protein ACP5NZ_03955 [Nanobdellota archaeon]
MKKRLIFFVLLFLFLFSFLSFTSAGMFNKKKITGEVIGPINEAFCTESDGGLNYYLKGLARGNISKLGEKYNGLIGQVYDFCVQLGENNSYPWINESSTWDSWGKYEIQSCEENCAIYESYCKEGLILSVIPKCPEGCFNGACILETEDCSATKISNLPDRDNDGCNAGTDSDCGGIESPDDPVNTCFDGIDNDCDGMIDSLDDDLSCNVNCGDKICGWYERIESSKYSCPGDCITSEYCVDNDRGLNYYLYGAIVGLDRDGEGNPPGDYCLPDGSAVMEGYCASEGYVNFYSYPCPNGCKDGACLEKQRERCNAPLVGKKFQDTDNDGCTAGTDSDCGGIESSDDSVNTCFDGIDNDCDGMIDSLDDDLSCNVNCGDKVCGVYERIDSSRYYCLNDCIKPDCLNCIDNDGGLSYYVYGIITGPDRDGEGNPPGDYCLPDGSAVMEGYCASEGYVDFYSYPCPNGCKDGACIQQNTTCVDIDRGLNYYVYGTIKGPSQDRKTNPPGDYCWEDSRGIMEAYCNKGYIDFYSYPCPNGCKNGRCVRNNLVQVLDSFI